MAKKKASTKKSKAPSAAKSSSKKRGTAAKPASKRGETPAATRGSDPSAKRNTRRPAKSSASEKMSSNLPASKSTGGRSEVPRKAETPPTNDGKASGKARKALRTSGSGGSSKRVRDGRTTSAAPPEQKTPKTRLTPTQLQQFKDLLLAKRAELLSDVRMLTKDALGKSRKDSSGDLSSMPIHMADIGSDNWEQDFTLGLIANERQLVREIDAALQRIDERTYGICLATHKPITVARLRAKPWAKYCIEYAQQLERRGY